MKGYDLFRCDRKVNTRGGGVLLYVKHGLGVVQVNVNTEFPASMCGGATVALTLKVLIVLCDRKVNTRGGGVLFYVKHGLGAV